MEPEELAQRMLEAVRLVRALERIHFLAGHLSSAKDAMNEILEVAPQDVQPEMMAAYDALVAIAEAAVSANEVLSAKIELLFPDADSAS